MIRKILADDARDDVVGAPRRKRDDPVYRPRRIGLRPRDPWHRQQRGSTRCQMQKISAGKFHFEPSLYLLIRSPRRRGRAADTLLQHVALLLEQAACEITEGRGVRTGLQPRIMRLARDCGIDWFDCADRLRKHLHARRTLDEYREHGCLL